MSNNNERNCAPAKPCNEDEALTSIDALIGQEIKDVQEMYLQIIDAKAKLAATRFWKFRLEDNMDCVPEIVNLFQKISNYSCRTSIKTHQLLQQATDFRHRFLGMLVVQEAGEEVDLKEFQALLVVLWKTIYSGPRQMGIIKKGDDNATVAVQQVQQRARVEQPLELDGWS